MLNEKIIQMHVSNILSKNFKQIKTNFLTRKRIVIAPAFTVSDKVSTMFILYR